MSTSRITSCFAKLKAANRKALIPFIMGGDPDMETSLAIARAVIDAGADVLEIGIPFSDPMADGPVIQAAGLRALQAGASVKKILSMITTLRKDYADVPVILMGYYNPIYHYGAEAFCRDAEKAGVDGLIIVDLPPEEEHELAPYLQKNGLSLIRLIAPTSVEQRLPMLLAGASGFAYYISITGITGAATATASDLKTQIGHIREHTRLPIAAGFGIKTPEQAKAAAACADAVVVGSALVDVIAREGIDAAAEFVRGLKAAIAT